MIMTVKYLSVSYRYLMYFKYKKNNNVSKEQKMIFEILMASPDRSKVN